MNPAQLLPRWSSDQRSHKVQFKIHNIYLRTYYIVLKYF